MIALERDIVMKKIIGHYKINDRSFKTEGPKSYEEENSVE